MGFGVRKSCSLNHCYSLNYCEEHDTLWAQIIGVNGVLQSLKIPWSEPVEKSVWSHAIAFCVSSSFQWVVLGRFDFDVMWKGLTARFASFSGLQGYFFCL